MGPVPSLQVACSSPGAAQMKTSSGTASHGAHPDPLDLSKTVADPVPLTPVSPMIGTRLNLIGDGLRGALDPKDPSTIGRELQ